MTDNIKLIKRSAWTSVLIGGPIGLLTALGIFLIPVLLSGEYLATFAIRGAYGDAIVGLLTSFIVALWFAGKKAHHNLKNGQGLLLVSFKYSVFVNVIIWTIFIFITIIINIKHFNFILLVPPILFLIVCPLLTTFSYGLLICYVIK
jgi:hypothetical protein